MGRPHEHQFFVPVGTGELVHKRNSVYIVLEELGFVEIVKDSLGLSFIGFLVVSSAESAQ